MEEKGREDLEEKQDRNIERTKKGGGAEIDDRERGK